MLWRVEYPNSAEGHVGRERGEAVTTTAAGCECMASATHGIGMVSQTVSKGAEGPVLRSEARGLTNGRARDGGSSSASVVTFL